MLHDYWYDPILSHRMYFLVSFRKSTPPQNINLLFNITDQKTAEPSESCRVVRRGWISFISAMVGVSHRPLLPSLPTGGKGRLIQVTNTTASMEQRGERGPGVAIDPALYCDLLGLPQQHPLLSDAMYLFISFRKSTPPQNRQLNTLIGNSKD